MKSRVLRSCMWLSDTPAFCKTFLSASSSPDKSNPFRASHPTCVTCLKFEGPPISALVSFRVPSRFLILELVKDASCWYGDCPWGGASFAKIEIFVRKVNKLMSSSWSYLYWEDTSVLRDSRQPSYCRCCWHCLWLAAVELVALSLSFDDDALCDEQIKWESAMSEQTERAESIKTMD